MNKILILGATGKLGKVLVSFLLIKNLELVVLARNPEKLNIKNSNLKIIKGNVTDSNDLLRVLDDVDVVISVLGHGFRTEYPILQKSLRILIPLMEEKKIKKFITVTGAALKTKEEKNSFTLNLTQKILGIIDPYRLNDSIIQQILLEKSNLDWTVIRTPIHKNGKLKGLNSIGYKQPFPWSRIARISIAEFIYECIKEDKWIKKSPIIY